MSYHAQPNRMHNGQGAGPFTNHGYSNTSRLTETPQPPPAFRPNSGSSAASSSYGHDSSITESYPSGGPVASNFEKDQLKYYAGLRKFLAVPAGDEASRNFRSTRALDKLQRLTTLQVHELSQDAHDELLRRQLASASPARNIPTSLDPQPDFHDKRNHARNKLSTLQPGRFKDLATDILCEIERRNPHIHEKLIIAQSVEDNPANSAGSPRGMSNTSRNARHSPTVPSRSNIANTNSPTPIYTMPPTAPAGPANGADARLLPPLSPLKMDFHSDAKSSENASKPTNKGMIVPNTSTLIEKDQDLDEIPLSSPPHLTEKAQKETTDRYESRDTGTWPEPLSSAPDDRVADASSPMAQRDPPDSASSKAKSMSVASRISATQRMSDLPVADNSRNKSPLRSPLGSQKDEEVEGLRLQLERQRRNVALAERSLAESANSSMYKKDYDDQYELSQLEREKTELEREIKDLQARLLEAEKSSKQLETMSHDLETQLAVTNLNNETDRANLDCIIFEKDERNKELQAQIEVLHHMLEDRAHDEESEQDESRKSERERENAELQTQLEELLQQKSDLEMELDAVRHSNIEKEEDRDALKRELTRLSEEFSLKLQESEEIEQLKKKWHEKQESLEALLNIERNHSNTLQDGLDRITSTKEEDAQKMADLEARVETLQAENASNGQLIEIRSALEQKVDHLESRNAELQVEVSALQRELGELRENAVDGEELIKARNNLEEQTVRMEVLELNLHQADQTVIKLEAALNAGSNHDKEHEEMKSQLEAALKEIEEHEKIKAELKEEEGTKYQQLKHAHLVLRNEHQEYLEHEAELKQQLEEHLLKVEANGRSYEKWKQKHKALEQDFKTKQDEWQTTLKSQQDEWQSTLEAERQMRNALNEQISSQPGDNVDWKAHYEELDQKYSDLQIELEHQQENTENVRQQASTFLEEMRMLSEEKESRLDSEENNCHEIERLQKEVKLWKDRYESSCRPNDAYYVNMFAAEDSQLVSDKGAVSSNQVNKFPLAIDSLLHKARHGESQPVMDQITPVVSAIRGIMRDLNKSLGITATPEIFESQKRVLESTNNLVTVSKNFCESVSLPPISMNAAASRLSATVLSLLRIIKVRPSSDGNDFTRISNYSSDAPSQIQSEVSRNSGHSEKSSLERSLPPLPGRNSSDETVDKPLPPSNSNESVNAITLLTNRNQYLAEASHALVTLMKNTNSTNFSKSRHAFRREIDTICLVIGDFIEYTDKALSAPGDVTDAAFAAPILTLLEIFAAKRESLLNVAGLLDKDSQDHFADTAKRLQALIKEISGMGNQLVTSLTEQRWVDDTTA